MFKRIMLGVAGGMLAVSVGAAGAYFTAQTQVPENIIRAGTVALSAEPASAALDIDNLAPGIPGRKSLTVTNTGTLPVDIVATAAKRAGITEFYEALTCRVYGGGELLFDGRLAELRTAPVRVDPSSATDLEFEMEIPAEAGNSLVGDYVKITVYIDGEQAR